MSLFKYILYFKGLNLSKQFAVKVIFNSVYWTRFIPYHWIYIRDKRINQSIYSDSSSLIPDFTSGIKGLTSPFIQFLHPLPLILHSTHWSILFIPEFTSGIRVEPVHWSRLFIPYPWVYLKYWRDLLLKIFCMEIFRRDYKYTLTYIQYIIHNLFTKWELKEL